MDKGYILLSRSLLDSDVFSSQKLLKIWIWCLCKANFKSRAITHTRGSGEQIIRVKRGQFIFGRYKAEEELFIDGSTIYKCIKRLEKMDMIKIESSKSFSVITICKYDTYQDNKTYKVTTGGQQGNKTVPTEAPQSNTTNTLNTLPKVKEIYIPSIREFMAYAKSKDKEYERKKNGIKLKYESWIENGWKNGLNKPIKNWKVTLLNTLVYIKTDYIKQQTRL